MKKTKKKDSQEMITIKAFRRANRNLEMERNGYRWIAIDRPHKNKKRYDRKRDRRIDTDGLSFVYALYDYSKLMVGHLSVSYDCIALLPSLS